jgi:hypothetical protein
MTSSKELAPKDGLLSNSPGYTLLAIYMPLTILTAAFFLIKGFLPFPLSPALFLISGGISAVAASFYCDFMKDSKTSRFAANIRGGLIVMGISYIISSLFRWGIPWDKRLLPNFPNIIVSVGALYAWVSVVSLKQLFTDFKRLAEYTTLYQGEQLHKMLYKEISLLQNTNEGLIKTKRNYFFQLVFIGLLVLVNVLFSNSLSLVMYLLLIVILAGGICILGFFETVRWEHTCATEGMPFSAYNRTKRMLGVGIFSALSVIVAVLLSSSKSILPLSLITGFFAWLAGLFRRNPSQTTEIPSPDFTDPLMVLPDYDPMSFEGTADISSWPFLAWLRYGFIAIAAALFILFMISPLLNRGNSSAEMTFRQKLGRIITELFKGVLNGLASLFAFFKSRSVVQKLRKPGAEEIQRMAGAVLGAYSQAKKSDMKRSVTLFARLIIWGSEVRSVIWKPVHAPGEYCRRLSSSVPSGGEAGLRQRNKEIIRCGEIFEKALYSNEVLSDLERKEFNDLIEGITAASA